MLVSYQKVRRVINIVTVMCKSTRYPATLKTKPVLKALTYFMTTFGDPKVVQTDQGSNFMPRILSQVLKKLKVKHQVSRAYLPDAQGAIECFPQTSNYMLRSFCTELLQDWEEGLPWLLLASRDVAQESTGFSPKKHAYGHTV